MKKSLLYLTLFFGSSFVFSQDNQVPLSWIHEKDVTSLETIEISKPDVASLLKEDSENLKNGKFFRIGKSIETNFSPKNSGKWDFLNDGSAIWRAQFSSLDAFAISFGYSEFSIPEGASLYIYNKDRSHVIGPFTSEDCPEDGGIHATSMVNSSSVIIEYNQPKSSSGNFNLTIADFVYYYRPEAMYFRRDTKDFGDSESCEVNVNCSEGNSWRDEQRGVVRILLKEGSSYGWCSGSLINNTLQDCTPYVLTANHCGAGASASDMRQWIFYFNYEAPTCSNPGSEGTLAQDDITGSVKVSSSGSTSDVTKSDFLLLIIKNRPGSTFNAYLNGWSKSTTASSSGVSIHHPAGDIKKISTYNSSLSSTTWSGSGASGGHWRVNWNATANGHGVTEGGSSGSPIFNSSGLIVGDLSGGASYCAFPSGSDSYGKFSYSWESCGTTNDRQLKPWLDKNSSGVTTLTGKDNTCTAASLPTVEFVADNEWPIINQTVTFTDQTTNSPFYWRWVFTPSTYTFVNGTNEYSQNPQVQFTAAGNYLATLYAANTAGYNYKNKSNYIHVGFVGLEEEETKQIQTYPNPSDGNFVLQLSEGLFTEQTITISVQDLQGKLVYITQNANNFGNLLPLSLPNNLSNGIYIINVYDAKNKITERIEIIR